MAQRGRRSGKTAIGQSFIEQYLRHGLVLASFFFGRSDDTRNHTGSLIATLAYQIYLSVLEVQDQILAIIDTDPLIFTRNLERQFTELLTKPLASIYSSGAPQVSTFHRAIIIDGLDECLKKEERQQILRIISKSIRQSNLSIVFLIASRPETDIKFVFESQDMKGIVTRLNLDDDYKPDDDIRRYLEESFKEIRATRDFAPQTAGVWPDPRTIDSLVKKASGQFIYAVTVVRYVNSNEHLPHHRLAIIMDLRPHHGDLPFAQLDAIYRMIFSSAKNLSRALYALSIYSHRVFHGASPFDISQFMSLEHGEIRVIFCDIWSLVALDEIPNGPSTVRFLHSSLHDFLLDPIRSEKYFLDIDTYRTQHLENIFHYLTLALGESSVCIPFPAFS